MTLPACPPVRVQMLTTSFAVKLLVPVAPPTIAPLKVPVPLKVKSSVLVPPVRLAMSLKVIVPPAVVRVTSSGVVMAQVAAAFGPVRVSPVPLPTTASIFVKLPVVILVSSPAAPFAPILVMLTLRELV